MKNIALKLATKGASTLLLLSICMANTQAQTTVAIEQQADTANTAGEAQSAQLVSDLNNGLKVNEIRIKGRRDAVEVQRKNGSIDYYSDSRGLYAEDEGSGLGTHATLRTWRFGN